MSVGASISHVAPLALFTGAQMMRWFFRWGVVGLFFVSIVDSSFVPLPVPGITDIMIILFAAQNRTSPLYLAGIVIAATVGSAIGGGLSHAIGQAGGVQFLENHVPKRILDRVTGWMQRNAILAVALPAILPPPMPLAPFVLAAGALKMSRTKFMYSFTISRAVRHLAALWLGIHYGPAVLHLWNRFSAKYATPILIVLWVFIVGAVAFAAVRLYKTSKTVGFGAKSPEAG